MGGEFWELTPHNFDLAFHQLLNPHRRGPIQETGPEVMPTPRDAADALLSQLATEALALDAAISAQDAHATAAITRMMNSLVSILETCWPQSRLAAELGNLKRHISFPAKYAPLGEWARIEHDPKDCQSDIAGLRKQLASVPQWIPPTIEGEVLSLAPGSERELALEAVVCLQAGANRGAIVLAGLAMETRARSIYQHATGTDPMPLTFYDVIDALDKLAKASKIGAAELPAIDIVRLYRNLAAHPNEFAEADYVAPQIVALAIGLIKRPARQP